MVATESLLIYPSKVVGQCTKEHRIIHYQRSHSPKVQLESLTVELLIYCLPVFHSVKTIKIY